MKPMPVWLAWRLAHSRPLIHEIPQVVIQAFELLVSWSNRIIPGKSGWGPDVIARLAWTA